MTRISLEAEKVQKIRILGGSKDNKYPIVPMGDITVVERPEEGKESEQLFYNPRSIESMTSEVMSKLRESIRIDGLHSPLMVRAITEDGTSTGSIIRVELVAGERRFRSLQYLYDDNTLVFDWKTRSMLPAQQVYTHVPCEVLYNITDEEALHHAWTENDEREALRITDEIKLVERLTKAGLLQEEIAELLGTNVTWVSQTVNFRKELPGTAFERLAEGKISRHVAVQILGYSRKDREQLVEEAVRVEQEERESALKNVQTQIEDAEDQEDILSFRTRQAAKRGDEASAKRAAKKAAAAAKKAAAAVDKKNRINADAGIIRQGHLARGAVAAQVVPRKAKILTRGMIEQFLLELPLKWQQIGKVDPICKQAYPVEMLALTSGIAEGILSGNADPGSIIRKTLVSLGKWEMPEGIEEPEIEMLEIEEGDEEIEEIEAA